MVIGNAGALLSTFTNVRTGYNYIEQVLSEVQLMAYCHLQIYLIWSRFLLSQTF